MKRRQAVRILSALCVLLAFSLPFCAVRCVAEEASLATSPPVSDGMGGGFPYLLGTGVLLGMFAAVRLRRRAEQDPTRR